MYPKLTKVLPQENHQIYVEYDDGSSGIINFSPDTKPRYKLFEDPTYFAKAHQEHNAIVRDEQMDVCGDRCYMQITK